MASLLKRDLYFNKLCASSLIPNKLRSALYRWGRLSENSDNPIAKIGR